MKYIKKQACLSSISTKTSLFPPVFLAVFQAVSVSLPFERPWPFIEQNESDHYIHYDDNIYQSSHILILLLKVQALPDREGLSQFCFYIISQIIILFSIFFGKTSEASGVTSAVRNT